MVMVQVEVEVMTVLAVVGEEEAVAGESRTLTKLPLRKMRTAISAVKKRKVKARRPIETHWKAVSAAMPSEGGSEEEEVAEEEEAAAVVVVVVVVP